MLPPWPLLGEALDALARELIKLESSPLVLSELQKRERADEVRARGAATLFDAPVRERYARRLEETAVFLRAEDELAAARTALAEAELGFLRRVLEVSLEIASSRLREAQAEQLVVPG